VLAILWTFVYVQISTSDYSGKCISPYSHDQSDQQLEQQSKQQSKQQLEQQLEQQSPQFFLEGSNHLVQFEVQDFQAPNSLIERHTGYHIHSGWKLGSRVSEFQSVWDITLTTQLSIGRLGHLLDIIEQWKGPVSCAIIVKNRSEKTVLERWWNQNPIVAEFADIHLVFGDLLPFPINFLRNIGIAGVRYETGFYFVVDADVWLSGSMNTFSHELEKIGSLAPGNNFVVAAFESKIAFPLSFDDLKEMYLSGKASAMHAGRRSYSGPFSHRKWFASHSWEEIRYEVMFEPYYITRKHQKKILTFPEEFKGRGFNKQAHHFQMWAAGFKYYSLPYVYIFDRPHDVSIDLGIEDNKSAWITFRASIANTYGMVCRQIHWAYCDRTGKNCDLVCQETRTSFNAWNSFQNELKDKPRKEKIETSCFEDGMNPVVDVVYTWVNGSDPIHVAIQKLYIPISEGNQSHRFRDFGKGSTLKYSLRSVFKHMPWIRNIWIVTMGQTPSWLNVSKSDRIKMVDHSDIFDDLSKLPTLNSCAIESQLHNIKGLSECYIYMNDDFLVASELNFDNFWSGNLPVVTLEKEPAPRVGKNPWQKKIATVSRMISSKLNIRRVFHVGHHGVFYVKSLVKEVIKLMPKEFEETSRQRWRTSSSVWLPLVYSNYLASAYATSTSNPNLFYFATSNKKGVTGINTAFLNLNKATGIQWLCFNDLLSSFSNEIENALHAGFDALYPTSMIYEISN